MLTEKEKRQRARTYMWKLHEGIDPISGQRIPEDSVLNNERLKRCFAYVFDVLGKSIMAMDAEEKNPEAEDEKRKTRRNAGYNDKSVGKSKKSRKTKESFYITDEELDRIKPLENDCLVSELVRHINDTVADESRKKLRTVTISRWMVDKGFLSVSDDGMNHKELTEYSGEIGLESQRGVGAYGEYTIVRYTPKAQRFVLDNLQQMLEWEREENENEKI